MNTSKNYRSENIVSVNEHELKQIVSESVKRVLTERELLALNEGIDIDEYNLTVSYNESHENNVETSELTNPTVIRDKYVPVVEVWSIFKRKIGCKDDGNPLVFALKRENNWKFATKEDKLAILRQINLIADKFFKEHSYPVTIMLPSNGVLNRYILRLAKFYNKGTETIDDLMIKLPVSEV